MEKELKKKFEKEVYVPLRKEITYTGIFFFLIGVSIIIWEHFPLLSSIALGMLFMMISLAFFFRKQMFDKGFASKGDPVNRFNLNLALQERVRRLKVLQEIHYSLKRAEKIRIIEEWLDEE
jgi:hypothetical protein